MNKNEKKKMKGPLGVYLIKNIFRYIKKKKTHQVLFNLSDVKSTGISRPQKDHFIKRLLLFIV